jgi:hypothetical protein
MLNSNGDFLALYGFSYPLPLKYGAHLRSFAPFHQIPLQRDKGGSKEDGIQIRLYEDEFEDIDKDG